MSPVHGHRNDLQTTHTPIHCFISPALARLNHISVPFSFTPGLPARIFNTYRVFPGYPYIIFPKVDRYCITFDLISESKRIPNLLVTDHASSTESTNSNAPKKWWVDSYLLYFSANMNCRIDGLSPLSTNSRLITIESMTEADGNLNAGV
jgi:hypothetical protein